MGLSSLCVGRLLSAHLGDALVALGLAKLAVTRLLFFAALPLLGVLGDETTLGIDFDDRFER
jgi:hypothetical protein